MRGLPRGWAWATLGDVLDRIEAGRSFGAASRPARDGEWGIVRVSAMTWGEFRPGQNKAVPPDVEIDQTHAVRAGDILLSRANTAEYVGASVRVRREPQGLLLSDKSLRLVPNLAVAPEFLLQLLSSPVVRSQISKVATGTKDSMRNISQISLRQIDVMLPPLSEQQRIVAALEQDLSIISAGSESIESASGRVSYLMRSAVSQAFERALRSGASVSVDTVAEVRGGIQKQQKRLPRRNFYPFLRVANVGRARLLLKDVHKIELFDGEEKRVLLQDGDRLVVEGNGSPSQIGRAARWRGEIAHATHQNHLIRVRPGKSLNPDYLELIWNSPAVVNQLLRVASSSSGLYTLSTSKVSSVRMPVPPLSTQDQLVGEVRDIVDHARRLGAAAANAVSRADALRTALLAAAADGSLVDQDPTDEPADVLLARIRAEREAAGPKPRKPRARKATTT